MEKQHNRGQEGAGLGCIKFNARPGNEFVFRERALGSGAIQEIFANVKSQIEAFEENSYEESELPFVGELYMGHLRYSTTGKTGINYVHPFLRRNNWRVRNMLLCGNFNMTNVDEIFEKVVDDGQHPRIYSDTVLLLEQLGHKLDNEAQKLYLKFKKEKNVDGKELTNMMEDNIQIKKILYDIADRWDGGFVICGALGSGDMFVLRDSHGIRPAFYYCDDEVVVVASERPVIQTTFDVRKRDVKELRPGSAITVNKAGEIEITDILGEKEKENGNICVRSRKEGDLGARDLEEWIKEIKEERDSKRI